MDTLFTEGLEQFAKYFKTNEISKNQCYENPTYVPKNYDKSKYNALIPITVNDFRFLPILMKSMDAICGRTVFIYSDYLFNQEKQDENKLQHIFDLPKKLNLKGEFRFVKYDIDFDVDEYKVGEYNNSPKRYWINHARYTGINHVDENAEWLLLIDSDEIPNVDKYLEYMDNLTIPNDILTLNFDNYVYFWKNHYVKMETENSIVLLRNVVWKNKEKYHRLFYNEFERTVFYKYFPVDKCIMNIKNNDSECLFHHYSWVRNLDEMKSKVINWGHSDDHLSLEYEFEDGTKMLEKNKVMLNYMYANLYGYQFMLDTPEFKHVHEQIKKLMPQFVNVTKKMDNIKKINKLYPEGHNTYMEGVLKWFENPQINTNFMGYNCYKSKPVHFVDYKYEDF